MTDTAKHGNGLNGHSKLVWWLLNALWGVLIAVLIAADSRRADAIDDNERDTAALRERASRLEAEVIEVHRSLGRIEVELRAMNDKIDRLIERGARRP